MAKALTEKEVKQMLGKPTFFSKLGVFMGTLMSLLLFMLMVALMGVVVLGALALAKFALVYIVA